MNIMKKLFILSVMTFGVMAVAKAPAFAHDYVSSTWTARLVAYISTQTDTSKPPATIGGITQGGGFDMTRVWLSSGYNNGTYFLCVDTVPLSGTVGAPAYSQGIYPNEQYLFPPVPFLPSTATIQGASSGLMLDFRDYQGGGKTIKNGLVCLVYGEPGTTTYRWHLELSETPSATERR